MRIGAGSVAIACGFLVVMCGLRANAQDQTSNPPSFYQTYQNAVAQARQKCHELWSDHAFDPLRSKIQVGETKPSFKMLTSTERFPAKDKPLGDLFIQALEKCRSAWAPVYSMLPSQASALIHGVEREQDALIAELYNGKITFGAFNVGMNRLVGKVAEALSGIQKSSEPRTASNAGATENIIQKSPLPEPRPKTEQRITPVPAQFHETRLALVIGNSYYTNLRKLSNPTNDARSIAEALQKLGYKTQLLLDASDQKIRSEVRSFASESSKADVALVYYAGHGAQLNGSNYLLPVDIDVPRTEADIQFGGLKVDDLVNSIGSGTKIVFLDACRDNPALFKNIVSGRGSSPVGLAPATASNFTPTNPGGGVFIAYATDAGSIADDGHGPHSPFTEALLRYIQKPISIDDMFSLVTREVRLVTKNAQRPYKYASLENIVCLPPGCSNAPPPVNPDIFQQARQSESDELQIALQTNNPDALESYLQQYPDTAKRSEILSKIDNLRRAEFTEWTLFEMSEQKYPQFMKLSSIQRFGDRAAVLLRQTVSPSDRQIPDIATHPETKYVDLLNAYDCKWPTYVSAEETLVSAREEVIYHYKFGDPRYVGPALIKIAPGTIALSARSIACYQEATIPAATKSQLSKMKFESLSSTDAGDGEIFYKVLSAKRGRQNEKQLLFIIRFFSERDVPLVANASIPNSPKYRTEVDTAILNCKARRIFSFVNEFYNSANELVFLRAPTPIPDDINSWMEIIDKPSPLSLLHKIVCNGVEAQQ
jgi:uncharacterized caspase-like protein